MVSAFYIASHFIVRQTSPRFGRTDLETPVCYMGGENNSPSDELELLDLALLYAADLAHRDLEHEPGSGSLDIRSPDG